MSAAIRRLGPVSEPRPSDRHDASESDDTFAEIVDEATQRDPDLAVIEAGSRTLRTQSGPPVSDAPPAMPADPETAKALRAVEQELAAAGVRPSSNPPSPGSPP